MGKPGRMTGGHEHTIQDTVKANVDTIVTLLRIAESKWDSADASMCDDYREFWSGSTILLDDAGRSGKMGLEICSDLLCLSRRKSQLR